jgi:TPR repeat protein
MHKSKFAVSLFAAALMLAGRFTIAQQSKTPTEPSKGRAATLILLSDLPCTWTLDGVAKGKIQPDESVNAEVAPGPHSIQAAGDDKLDTLKIDFTIEPATQKIVQLQFIPARAIRQDAENEARKQRLLEREALSAQSPDEKFKEAVAHFEKREYTPAKPVFSSGCTGGNVVACVYLARIYGDKQGGNYDKFMATALFSRACDKGDAEGCAAYRDLSPQQTAPATEQALPVTAQGSLAEQETLAEHLYARKQWIEARLAFDPLCKQRQANACLYLGKIFEHGRGVGASDLDARAYYAKACDFGNKDGCDKIEQMNDSTNCGAVFGTSCTR